MKATATKISDVLIIEPTLYEDERGYFFESFNQQIFNAAIGREVTFVQDNHSCSVKGVLRGLHYQQAPHVQGKLIRVIAGEVFDVAVDIRPSSPTFGQWIGIYLSATNKKQLWVPEGCAHGFLVVSEIAEVLYKMTHYWCKAAENTILWNDPSLSINWPLSCPPLLSSKDRVGNHFAFFGQ